MLDVLALQVLSLPGQLCFFFSPFSIEIGAGDMFILKQQIAS